MTTATYCSLEDAAFAVFGPAKSMTPEETSLLSVAVNAASRQIDKYCDRPDGFGLPGAQTARVFIPSSWDWCFVDDIADANEAAITLKTDDGADRTYNYTWRATTPPQFQLEPVNAHVRGEGEPFTGIRATYDHLFPADYGTGFLYAGGQRLEVPDMPLSGLAQHQNAVVQVTAKWGWPAVPSTIKDAAIQQVIYLWKSFSAPFGIAGAGDAGEIRMLGAQLHPTARSLCFGYRKEAAGLAITH